MNPNNDKEQTEVFAVLNLWGHVRGRGDLGKMQTLCGTLNKGRGALKYYGQMYRPKVERTVRSVALSSFAREMIAEGMFYKVVPASKVKLAQELIFESRGNALYHAVLGWKKKGDFFDYLILLERPEPSASR